MSRANRSFTSRHYSVLSCEALDQHDHTALRARTPQHRSTREQGPPLPCPVRYGVMTIIISMRARICVRTFDTQLTLLIPFCLQLHCFTKPLHTQHWPRNSFVALSNHSTQENVELAHQGHSRGQKSEVNRSQLQRLVAGGAPCRPLRSTTRPSRPAHAHNPRSEYIAGKMPGSWLGRPDPGSRWKYR